jgi:hypothetical protein
MLTSLVEMIIALICLAVAGRIVIGLIDEQRSGARRRR